MRWDGAISITWGNTPGLKDWKIIQRGLGNCESRLVMTAHSALAKEIPSWKSAVKMDPSIMWKAFFRERETPFLNFVESAKRATASHSLYLQILNKDLYFVSTVWHIAALGVCCRSAPAHSVFQGYSYGMAQYVLQHTVYLALPTSRQNHSGPRQPCTVRCCCGPEWLWRHMWLHGTLRCLHYAPRQSPPMQLCEWLELYVFSPNCSDQNQTKLPAASCIISALTARKLRKILTEQLQLSTVNCEVKTE